MQTDPIPYGYCRCGCGEQAPIAQHNRPERGWTKGEPILFIRGHNRRAEMSGVNYPPEERFLANTVVQSDDCIVWNGSLASKGYGVISVEGVQTLVHRYAYELAYGPIPDGLQIDHLCRNRACVNSAHLEAVTQRTNLLRGDGICARNARKTHCKYGHPFDEENTKVSPEGYRTCMTCARAAWRRSRERKARAV